MLNSGLFQAAPPERQSQQALRPDFQLAGRLRSNMRNIKMNKMMEIDPIDTLTTQNEEEDCNVSAECLLEMAARIQGSLHFRTIFLGVMLIFTVSCLLWDPNANQKMSQVCEIV